MYGKCLVLRAFVILHSRGKWAYNVNTTNLSMTKRSDINRKRIVSNSNQIVYLHQRMSVSNHTKWYIPYSMISHSVCCCSPGVILRQQQRRFFALFKSRLLVAQKRQASCQQVHLLQHVVEHGQTGRLVHLTQLFLECTRYPKKDLITRLTKY